MNKLDDKLEDEYQMQENIKKAIKYKVSNKVIKVEEGKKVKLMNKIKGEDYSCPEYHIEIEYKGKKMNFKCKTKELGFQSFVKDSKLESKGSITCDSPEKAKELTELIIKECQLVKYK